MPARPDGSCVASRRTAGQTAARSRQFRRTLTTPARVWCATRNWHRCRLVKADRSLEKASVQMNRAKRATRLCSAKRQHGRSGAFPGLDLHGGARLRYGHHAAACTPIRRPDHRPLQTADPQTVMAHTTHGHSARRVSSAGTHGPRGPASRASRNTAPSYVRCTRASHGRNLAVKTCAQKIERPFPGATRQPRRHRAPSQPAVTRTGSVPRRRPPRPRGTWKRWRAAPRGDQAHVNACVAPSWRSVADPDGRDTRAGAAGRGARRLPSPCLTRSRRVSFSLWASRRVVTGAEPGIEQERLRT